MMTVKHVDPEGVERVFEVTEVTFRRAGDGLPDRVEMIMAAPAQLPDGPAVVPGMGVQVFSGQVYVMNGGGQTVAVYRMPPASAPAQRRDYKKPEAYPDDERPRVRQVDPAPVSPTKSIHSGAFDPKSGETINEYRERIWNEQRKGSVDPNDYIVKGTVR